MRSEQRAVATAFAVTANNGKSQIERERERVRGEGGGSIWLNGIVVVSIHLVANKLHAVDCFDIFDSFFVSSDMRF